MSLLFCNLGTQGWHHRRVSSSNSTATCSRIPRDSNNLGRKFALREGRPYNSSCTKTKFVYNFSKSAYICVWVCAQFFIQSSMFSYLFSCILQQHSFYELIVNKARGKSGPVCFFYSFFLNLLCLFHFPSCASKISWKQYIHLYYIPFENIYNCLTQSHPN